MPKILQIMPLTEQRKENMVFYSTENDIYLRIVIWRMISLIKMEEDQNF